MTASLLSVVVADDDGLRNTALEDLCRGKSAAQLLAEVGELDQFRRQETNLYLKVRALFFLYAVHRFSLPFRGSVPAAGSIPFDGHQHLLQRRFEEAIDRFLAVAANQGPSGAISSALAEAYRGLGFQTLADQVRRSVRSVRGNQWMFRIGHPADQPLRVRPELSPAPGNAAFPVLREQTPVRMDLSHSAWSDIFFLGMDYPEGARVLNVSIDLGVRGRDRSPQPPVETYFRLLDEPVLRLTSVDLEATADVTELGEVFDFARDYLGLLKAAVIASGLVPPGMEGSGAKLADLLEQLAGPGRGIEIVSHVRDIPKGSRLAVSTNLLGSLISVCMRATGQTHKLTGPLQESERRVAAARAILGEWLGGSGGGWQDSGGLWPGIKLITGHAAQEGDPEFGVSRGCLLPRHQILDTQEIPQEVRDRLQDSLVLVHGGMAQNVGPILEMVTEKYLLRSGPEWRCRQQASAIFDQILDRLQSGDVEAVGDATMRNFFGPLLGIIPWVTNPFTERLIEQAKKRFQNSFHGFWMLGGMSGGGMGFIFEPSVKARAQDAMLEFMVAAKSEFESGLPFAMDPVVYDFSINPHGSTCERIEGADAAFPAAYYSLTIPQLLRQDRRQLSPARRAELQDFSRRSRREGESTEAISSLFERLLPTESSATQRMTELDTLLEQSGFDAQFHERIRADLTSGRIGLAQNRLPLNAAIEDVEPGDVLDLTLVADAGDRERGEAALRDGQVAVLTLAAGAGSRWSGGAGVVKALNPFCKLGGRHRTFLEVHRAKIRRVARNSSVSIPHLVSTSYLTHEPILRQVSGAADAQVPVMLSPGRAVGLRLVPTVRDLRFAWEELSHQVLDEQAQKVRDSLQATLLKWAADTGEASDYTDNVPLQCLHPVGHWYEFPNLLSSGVMTRLLEERPNLRVLMLHNIDTLGADLDAELLGRHLREQACLTFEVIPRQVDDRGGGLARVNGVPRLVEGLAMPREEDEFKLSFYNSMTTWIDIDRLLSVFGLTRAQLGDADRVRGAVRSLSEQMPTYVTLKDVKKRWGHGQEDVFPVSQFEKLWSDMSALSRVDCRFAVVPRRRGQQLKDPAQLDGWVRDGSAAHVEGLCDFAP